jgi:hypothetical protein
MVSPGMSGKVHTWPLGQVPGTSLMAVPCGKHNCATVWPPWNVTSPSFAFVGRQVSWELGAKGGATVSESADDTGSMVVHAPSQGSGALNGTPAPMPGQAVVWAAILVAGSHQPPELKQAHDPEHVTVLGGASR